MSYLVRPMTAEELVAFPNDTFALLDDHVLLSTHHTEDDAKVELTKWRGRDKITEAIESFSEGLVELGATYGIDSNEVRLMMKDS